MAVNELNVLGKLKYVTLSIEVLYPVPDPPDPPDTAIEPFAPPLQLTFVSVNVAFGAVLDKSPTETEATVPTLLLFLT